MVFLPFLRTLADYDVKHYYCFRGSLVTFQVNRDLEPWVQSYRLRIDPRAEEAAASLTGSPYHGKYISILKLEASNASRILAYNPEDIFTFCIANSGFFRGVSGDRDISMSPKRCAFVLLPGECLKIVPAAEKISGYMFNVSSSYLESEAVKHGTLLPSLLTLKDSIPGHEQLILACSHQLLKFSSISEDMSSMLVLEPLENSIVSLLATLVGLPSDYLPKTSAEPPQQSHVDVALAYMESNITGDITLKDLCLEANVSSRTLQLSFQSVMGKTPLQVLQELRLNRLHDLILHGMEVGRACEHVGLRHCGRISAKYKSLFGELPRHTRARRI